MVLYGIARYCFASFCIALHLFALHPLFIAASLSVAFLVRWHILARIQNLTNPLSVSLRWNNFLRRLLATSQLVAWNPSTRFLGDFEASQT